MSFLPIFIGLTLALASLIENNDAFTLFPSSTITSCGRKVCNITFQYDE